MYRFGNRWSGASNGRSEHGAGALKAILWTALLVYAAFVGYKLIPVYIANYQLADKMQEQARFAVVNRYSEDQIREQIYKEVQELEIPTRKEEIKVYSTQQVVRVSLDYTVPVDLLFYKMQLHFTPSSENKALF